MAATQSFDITVGCDLQEIDNAVNQAVKEITQRYDFKGLKVSIEFQRADNRIVLAGPDDFKLEAMWEVLQTKLVKRQVALRNIKPGKIEPAAGGTVRQQFDVQQGIPTETARAIVKRIKDLKLKRVQAAIQDEQVRVSSPSRDDLQAAIAALKQEDFGMELRFGNYRTQ